VVRFGESLLACYAQKAKGQPQQYWSHILYSTTSLASLTLECDSETADLSKYTCVLASTYVSVEKQPDLSPLTTEDTKAMLKEANRMCSAESTRNLSARVQKELAEAYSPESRAFVEEESARGQAMHTAICACIKDKQPGPCFFKAMSSWPPPRTCKVAPPTSTTITFVRKSANTWTSLTEGMSNNTNLFTIIFDPAQDSWTYKETNVPSPTCGPTNLLEPTCEARYKVFSSHYSAMSAEKLGCDVVKFAF